MPKKLSIFLSVLFLCLSALACSTVDIFTEKTEIIVVSPDPEIRIVEEPHEDGSPVKVNLSIQMDTNKGRQIPAYIILDGVLRSEPCILDSNAKTNCGTLELYSKGQHTVRVEAFNLKGDVISSQVSFLWEPYIGWDKTALGLAKIAGSNSPTIGFFLFGVLFMVALNISILAIFKSWQSVIVGIVISTIILIVLFILKDPEVAANLFLALIGLISTAIFAGVLIYAMNNGYEANVGGSLYISLTDSDGSTRVLDHKPSSRIGRGVSGSHPENITKAFLEDLSRPKRPQLPEVTHTIDGVLVSEEAFIENRSRQRSSRPTQALVKWLLGKNKNKNQKRLS